MPVLFIGAFSSGLYNLVTAVEDIIEAHLIVKNTDESKDIVIDDFKVNISFFGSRIISNC